MKPTIIDLFAGCGGLSFGFQKAGFEVVGFIEQWKPAIETHLKNFPESKHIGFDINEVDEKKLEEYKGKIDVIIGSPPCQGFSMCGNRNPHDKRNRLYKEFLRIDKIIKPQYIIMENVAGLLSMKTPEGEKVINAIVDSLVMLGYSVCYKKLKAVDYGVAQKRERIIIIGKKCELYPQPTVTDHISSIEALQNIPESISGHIFSRMTKDVANKINKLKQGEKLYKKFNSGRQRIVADEPSPTITTVNNFIHPFEDRMLTPRELARLQSFPDSFEFCGTLTSITKQVGNAVPPLMAEALAKNILEELKRAG